METRASDRFELWMAALLGVAALATAFSALRASLLGDQVLQGYTESTQYYNDAIAFESEQTQQFVQDQGLFVRYVEAAQRGEDDLAGYLRDTLFTDNLNAAVTWWEESADASTPFDDGSPYEDAYAEEIAALNQQGDEAFESGKSADDRGDKFDIATAIFAVSLFVGGVASLMRSRAARLAMVGVGVGALVVGLLFAAQGQFG